MLYFKTTTNNKTKKKNYKAKRNNKYRGVACHIFLKIRKKRKKRIVSTYNILFIKIF